MTDTESTSADIEEAMQGMPPIDLITQAALNGATVKEVCGVSNETMDGIYAYAHRFYVNGQLDEAETFFRFLCLYDFHNGEYALGLGAVYQLRKQYERAIEMYSLAFALLQRDYRPMFHTAQCQFALGQLTTAARCFGFVVQSSTDADLVQRAVSYMEAIEASTRTGT